MKPMTLYTIRLEWVLALCLAVCLTGCGYRFSGMGELPGGGRTLAVAIFENRTTETGAETAVTNSLIREIQRNPNIVLAAEPGQAEAVLSGKIKSVSTETVAHDGTYTSAARRIKLWVDVKLTGKDGTTLWQKADISVDEAYEVAQDRLNTDRNREQAIERLAENLAERIHYSLTDAF